MNTTTLIKANEIKAEIDSLEKGFEKDHETFSGFFNELTITGKDITLYVWSDQLNRGIHINFHGDAFDFIKEVVQKQVRGKEQKLKELKEQLSAL